MAPTVISDFAWRQLPADRPHPDYDALGQTVLDSNGHSCIVVADNAKQAELFSGATWLHYARHGFTSAPFRLPDSMRAAKAAVDRERPLPRLVIQNIFERYCAAFDFDPQPDVCDCTADPEISMLVKGGIIAGGLHPPVGGEQEDLQRALRFVAQAAVATPGQLAAVWRAPAALLRFVRGVHSRLFQSQGEQRGFAAGEFRRENVRVCNSSWCPPQHFELAALMGEFAGWVGEAARTLDPVHFALELHCRFVYLHPFPDGNGRVARLLMNLALLEAGYPPVAVARRDKNKFCCALEAAFWGNKADYYSTLLALLAQSLEVYTSQLPAAPAPLPLRLTRQRNAWSFDSLSTSFSSLHVPTIWEGSQSFGPGPAARPRGRSSSVDAKPPLRVSTHGPESEGKGRMNHGQSVGCLTGARSLPGSPKAAPSASEPVGDAASPILSFSSPLLPPDLESPYPLDAPETPTIPRPPRAE